MHKRRRRACAFWKSFKAEKLGTLDDILKEAGYQRGTDGKWKSPRIVATEVLSLSA
jgi:hypothetical protein